MVGQFLLYGKYKMKCPMCGNRFSKNDITLCQWGFELSLCNDCLLIRNESKLELKELSKRINSEEVNGIDLGIGEKYLK